MDYLIVGSGLSALVFGSLMAKSGKKVQILEAHEYPGGFGHTFTMAKKYKFNAQLHYVWDLRLNTLYARAAGLWVKTNSTQVHDLYHQPMSQYLKRQCIQNSWLKLLTMYSYSMPLDLIDSFPAELAIPSLRDYVFVNWMRIKGGVYSYIEKILERFKGEILLNVEVAGISRQPDSLEIEMSDGVTHLFDRIVFATPPDQVMKLLSDPTNEEIKRFSSWQEDQISKLFLSVVILKMEVQWISSFKMF